MLDTIQVYTFQKTGIVDVLTDFVNKMGFTVDFGVGQNFQDDSGQNNDNDGDFHFCLPLSFLSVSILPRKDRFVNYFFKIYNI